MADQKLTALDAATSATTDDLVYLVDDPLGTPVSKKITFDNLQKSISVIGGAGGVSAQGDLIVPVNKIIYFGGASTDGSWRMYVSGSDFLVEKRVSGTWTESARWSV